MNIVELIRTNNKYGKTRGNKVLTNSSPCINDYINICKKEQ